MLQKKQRTADLNKQEQKELQELVEQIEQFEAKRLESMIALAGLWNVSIEELKKRLDIKTPDPHVW